ncbi:HAD hydrolase-like protein [Salegentibacter mishustinae]|uniref:HAD family hydrolase n=1 Tax=Salegentibacter mishustinae TaxID=270918 RepID=UPI001CE22223|nr:HAD hydrolase-like protein [Salegentibacter mishustinae]UBZ06856.1 HAD hydrolase-like protein [Salegentibacter mishustinae]
MISLKNKKNIFWDFDGVLMDSMPVRNKGFELVLKDYPEEQVQELMAFHLKNGGLSRYVKFRYFFEEIRKETISEDEVSIWASKFSEIMRENLVNENLIIQDSFQFVKNNYQRYQMHIVSGSDQEELRYLCKKLNIATFFNSIHGSPIPKIVLVENLLKNNQYKKEESILIGDSINDYEAAKNNNIEFFGYNNPDLKNIETKYIESLEAL